MQPLLVSAFFDIGRGDWKDYRRSSDFYIRSFAEYPARLPAPRYLLAPEAKRSALGPMVDYFNSAEPAELKAFAYLERTRIVMASEAFKALFRVAGKPEPANPEYRFADYNVVVLAKWDALERAYAMTRGRFSHYIWVDFGLGRRAAKRPYLPPPLGVAPVERDRIVISASRSGALEALDGASLAAQVRAFRDQTATSIMIVPADKLETFCSLARSSYELLLSHGLAADDQVVADICIRRRSELFHLSYPPAELDKYNHIHNILNGLDEARADAQISRLRSIFARPLARARIGLPMELHKLLRR